MVRNHVHKGSRLLVEGAIHTRQWEARDGTKRNRVEIEVKAFGGQLWLLDPVQKRNQRAAAEPQEEGDPGSFGTGDSGFTSTSFDTSGGFDRGKEAFDDEIPF